MLEVVERAAKKVGGITKLAERLGVKHPSFHDWKQVPAGRVIAISEITGEPPHAIRPDIYPAPIAETAA